MRDALVTSIYNSRNTSDSNNSRNCSSSSESGNEKKRNSNRVKYMNK